MTALFDDSPPPCPACANTRPKPLIFGAPSQEMLIAARLGEIALGGNTEDSPAQWICGNEQCGYRF